MGKALYRKYRSKSLDEIVGQEHITTTLGNALKSGNISHAYLFTGPRGTGKTSIARILAHEVNNLPYSDTAHLDIIEIDAASNRRIDEIRELRERVHVAPTSTKYKVYIIDEVHMLTKEAFNALLKTLEEPPEHVIFILATTEAHKLPDTIVSRTQRFTFKPIEKQAVVDHLRYIATEEGVTVTDEALELIATHGGGSFRDSISLLDQVKEHSDSISLEDVQNMLGIAPDEAVSMLLSTIQRGNIQDLVRQLESLREMGYQATHIAKQLGSKLRELLLSNNSSLEAHQVTTLLERLLRVPASHDPTAALELALIDIALQNVHESATMPVNDAVVSEPKEVQKPKEIEDDPVAVTKKSDQQELDESVWNSALETLKKHHNTLYSVSRMATPRISGQTITLVFEFAFHQKRLNEAKNKQIISDVLQSIAGAPVSLNCITTTERDQKPTKTSLLAAPDQTVATISNIFGGAEVLD